MKKALVIGFLYISIKQGEVEMLRWLSLLRPHLPATLVGVICLIWGGAFAITAICLYETETHRHEHRSYTQFLRDEVAPRIDFREEADIVLTAGSVPVEEKELRKPDKCLHTSGDRRGGIVIGFNCAGTW